MSRVPLLLVLAGGLISLSVALPAVESSEDPAVLPSDSSAAAPNIVVIQTDDQSRAMFNRRLMPRTFDLLGDRGVSFDEYVATDPTCCPSRATLLTGQYAHNHGVLSNQAGYPALTEPAEVLPAWLQRVGYRTAHVGKFLNGFEASLDAAPAPGWDVWRTIVGADDYYGYALSIDGTARDYGYSRPDYLTSVLARQSVRIIGEAAADGAPLFLELDELAPHTQNHNFALPCGGSAVPAPRDLGRHRDHGLRRPPSFGERSLRDKPSFVRANRGPRGGLARKVARQTRCRLASLGAVDRTVARIVTALRRARILRDTAIFFLSDNGRMNGEHGLSNGKSLPYEEALQVPLVVRLPAGMARAPGRIVHRLVGNVDLAPTILDLAGASPCTATDSCRVMDGRSLMPLLTDRGGWPRHRSLAIEFALARSGTGARSCRWSGVRTERDVYVVHTQVSGPRAVCRDTRVIEQYDLRRDPYELRNLANRDGDAAQRRRQLARRLKRLKSCAGIQARDPAGDVPFCR